MCGFFTTDELDDLLFEASEVARFLLEVEGTTLDIDDEIDIEDRITKVMRGVGEAAKTILKARSEDIENSNNSEKEPPQKNEPLVSIHLEQGTNINVVNIQSTESEYSINVIPPLPEEILMTSDISVASTDDVTTRVDSLINQVQDNKLNQQIKSDTDSGKTFTENYPNTNSQSKESPAQSLLSPTKDDGENTP